MNGSQLNFEYPSYYFNIKSAAQASLYKTGTMVVQVTESTAYVRRNLEKRIASKNFALEIVNYSFNELQTALNEVYALPHWSPAGDGDSPFIAYARILERLHVIYELVPITAQQVSEIAPDYSKSWLTYDQKQAYQLTTRTISFFNISER